MKSPLTYTEFKSRLSDNNAPAAWPQELRAMWYDFNNDWHEAHEIAQDLHSTHAKRIHGYLHWKEGDLWNARYWYRQAGTEFPGGDLKQEARAIVQAILSDFKP